MTRTLTRLLAVTLATALPLAAHSGTFQVTGSHGGTITGSYSCLWTKGQPRLGSLACQSQSTVTGPGGATGDRTGSATVTQGQLDRSVSGTRLNGRAFSRTVSRSR